LHDGHEFDGVDAELDEVVDARGEAAGRLQSALRETEIRAPSFWWKTGDPRRVVLNMEFVQDEILRTDHHMARRGIGRMVVDHALAAASVDRLRDVDEWS
jgi:hypothetical protein